MTTEDIFRNELLARETRLQEEIQNLTAQLNAVRTMLAASALQREPAPQKTAPPPPPVPIVTAAAPSTAALPPPPVPDHPRLAKSRKRGWLMDRIEELIQEGGPTFSLYTILDAYRAKWGWKNYPSKGVIGATLWRIVKRRGYHVHRPGGGKRATVYQKEPAR